MNRSDLGEGDDLVELARDLAALHSEDGAVQKDVLAAAQLGMEARADLEQRADQASDRDVAVRGRGDARQHFQQRALAGAIPADDADHLARRDLERDVAERPDAIVFAFGLGPATIQQSLDTARRRAQHVGERISQRAIAFALARGDTAWRRDRW